MSGVLRAGVIGAGVFGGYHAAKWAAMDGVNLTAVMDVHPERASALARTHGAAAFETESAFFDAVDIVSIAAPAAAHGDLALAALKAGKPVYVEKPLAVDPREADALLREAARRNLVLACGFLERAGAVALGLTSLPQTPLLIEAERLGVSGPRNRDVSVVLDLMIHDLDLALLLSRSEPFAVEASDGVAGEDGLDAVTIEATFESGLTASVRASRIAPSPRRTLRLVYPCGEIRIDWVTGQVDNSTPFTLNLGFAATSMGSDRLLASMSAFVAAVRAQTQRPMADGRDGARALDFALAAEQAAWEALG